ncbi:MAG: hypothetical protein LRZ85_01480 [Alphaproteobacteria bacterium]|nr:hypothetical protein [Alphaproteobacteria bacterium]MCD8571270.1 hypothetical protein [Alphaproteobacteria bacterium]
MQKILSLQTRTKSPWLLFLTTRAGDAHVHSDVLEILVNKYEANLNDCKPFRDASEKLFSINDKATLDAALGDAQKNIDVFITGLCKWIAGLSVAYNPPVKIELKSTMGYKVDKANGPNDLISIAIRFTPTTQPAPDLFGLSNNAATPISECDISPKIIKRIAKCVDVDAALAAEPTVLDEMIEASKNLLDLARYDIGEYEAFARA